MPVAPPRPKGPHLNALRAFEAAARLGGFAAAADELGVTPGAISQHIRSLEAWAGGPLFRRGAQGVRLTAAGEALVPGFVAAFDAMGEAVRALRAVAPRPRISIAALPSVAQLWLQPRLPALRAALPGMELSVTVLEQPPNLLREMFDVTLFMRDPRTVEGGLVLARDCIAPVCAPGLAERLRHPSDLSGHTLIHDESWSGDWAAWARATGAEIGDASRGTHFSLYGMAVAEAESGAGVLLGHLPLLDRALAAGRLVLPFDAVVPIDLSLVAEIAPGPMAGALSEALRADA